MRCPGASICTVVFTSCERKLKADELLQLSILSLAKIILPSTRGYADYQSADTCPKAKKRDFNLPASDLQLLQEWRVQHGQAVRQLTVRQLSTKDKPATLPISAYQKAPPEPQIVDVHGMLASDPERTHMPGDGVQGPTATLAIIYPVHSVVVTTAPVSETSSFGIVKLQADVTDADHASSTARAINGLC